jgi:UDP-glucose 4-epimerase
VRDYIHVNDLCEAHLLALIALLNGKSRAIYNLGTETGYTVQQVIETARLVTQCNISVKIAERRLGDPAILVADASLAKRELGWCVQYPMLQTIIEHAWISMKKNNLFNTASL